LRKRIKANKTITVLTGDSHQLKTVSIFITILNTLKHFASSSYSNYLYLPFRK